MYVRPEGLPFSRKVLSPYSWIRGRFFYIENFIYNLENFFYKRNF